jgi:hypothetical protein
VPAQNQLQAQTQGHNLLHKYPEKRVNQYKKSFHASLFSTEQGSNTNITKSNNSLTNN